MKMTCSVAWNLRFELQTIPVPHEKMHIMSSLCEKDINCVTRRWKHKAHKRFQKMNGATLPVTKKRINFKKPSFTIVCTNDSCCGRRTWGRVEGKRGPSQVWKKTRYEQGMKEFVEDSIRNLCNLFAILFAIYGFGLTCTFMQYFNRVMQSARYTDFQNAKLFMKTSIKKHDDWNFDTLLLLLVKIWLLLCIWLSIT